MIKAYVIEKTDDGYYLSDGNGLVIEEEELIDIGKNLIKFAKKHGKELAQHNIERRIEIEREIQAWKNSPNPKTSSRAKKGYVYLFECGGKYKVGYSKDVERRIKELDKRPFQINVVCVSRQIENAYEIEQNIHDYISQYKINGEWYELPDRILESICNYIKKV